MFDADFIKRFEGKFEKTDGCWIWRASTAGKGYGQIKLPKQRQQEYAHRIAYLLYKGEITAGWFVCHRCDVMRCVNPDHLFLGTSKDNQQDMAKKGRSTKGQKNPMSKLKEKQVIEIRKLYESGIPQQKIGEIYGVHQMHVSRIVRRERWKHVK